MKNWNTDATKMTGKTKRIWELSQLINYGLDGQKLSGRELRNNWQQLEPHLQPSRAEMLKWLLWGKRSSLRSSKVF